MTTGEPMKVHATKRLTDLCIRYGEAQRARLRWEQEEQSLKAAILEALDYDEDDPKPQPVTVLDVNDNPFYEVRIGTWRGHDYKWLKATHPDIMALAERTKPTKTIREFRDREA